MGIHEHEEGQVRKMAAWEGPNLDELHESTLMNYSNIDPFWIDKGYNKDNLPGMHKRLHQAMIIITVAFIIGYVAMWRTRKNLSLEKQLGEEDLSIWEKFCEGTKLGTEPAINFVSSCLITNDRVFIIIRIIMALYSLTLTILGFAGMRSIVFGSYFPLATIITIYVSKNPHVIVEGFGRKMQFVNKLLSFFFAFRFHFELCLVSHGGPDGWEQADTRTCAKACHPQGQFFGNRNSFLVSSCLLRFSGSTPESPALPATIQHA